MPWLIIVHSVGGLALMVLWVLYSHSKIMRQQAETKYEIAHARAEHWYQFYHDLYSKSLRGGYFVPPNVTMSPPLDKAPAKRPPMFDY